MEQSGLETTLLRADYYEEDNDTTIVRRPFAHAFGVVAALLVSSACGHGASDTSGYKPEVTPGMTQGQAEAILGKPQDSEPFSLPGISAQVLTYPFGQLLAQHGRIVAISVNNDPQFRGPAMITLGMSEDDLRAALAAHPLKRTGHKESYDAIDKSTDTRTKDIYDDTDHIMIELVAANPNDPLAVFNIAQVTFADKEGMQLIDSFTKARVDGLYPDVHVDNFITEPWRGGR